MGFYKKKPVEVVAYKLIDGYGPGIAEWCGGEYVEEAKASDHTDIARYIMIPTLEGNMRANFGDFIIKGVKGEFYPCKPDIFAATYDEVPDVNVTQGTRSL